ncbi:MAG TPA: folate-binding protein [Rudaea sp.]|nr:folate-binding protein [Rudaea sp.]
MISPPTQVLEITGADAAAFAHAQFCNDVLTRPDGHWQWNAWLSPQGRVRAFFRLLRIDAGNVLLTLRGGDAEWLRAELARYVFRAKVQLRAVNEATPSPAPEYSPLADIRAGIPEIGVELRDRLLPQWIGLDRLGAVSVNKGCYPGQEIMARLHFKGGNKRSLYRLRWSGSALAPPGALLRDPGGSEAGIIVTAAHDAEAEDVEALASISDSAADAVLTLESPPTRAVDIVQHFA